MEFFLLISNVALLLLLKVSADTSPVALNIVAIGFHRPELGYVSDY